MSFKLLLSTIIAEEMETERFSTCPRQQVAGLANKVHAFKQKSLKYYKALMVLILNCNVASLHVPYLRARL